MALKVSIALDPEALSEQIDEFEATLIDAMSDELISLGDKCKDTAWSVNQATGFADVTGALRSSIGASVYQDGFAIHDNYTEREGTNAKGVALAGGNRGVTAGRQLAEEVANNSGTELILVLTAGMPYASYVQQLRGRDVLASAWLLAQSEAKNVEESVIRKVSDQAKS